MAQGDLDRSLDDIVAISRAAKFRGREDDNRRSRRFFGSGGDTKTTRDSMTMGYRDKYLRNTLHPRGSGVPLRRIWGLRDNAGISRGGRTSWRERSGPQIRDTRNGSSYDRGVPNGKWLHDMYPGDAPEDDGDMEVEMEDGEEKMSGKAVAGEYDRVGALGAARLLRKSTTGAAVKDRPAKGEDKSSSVAVEGRQVRGVPEERRPIAVHGGRQGRYRSGDFGEGARWTTGNNGTTQVDEERSNRRNWYEAEDSTYVKFSNLEFSLMEDDLAELCKNYGDVQKVWIEYDRFDRSTGAGGCIFRKYSDAVKAFKSLDGRLVEGQNIDVELVENNQWRLNNRRGKRNL